MKKKFRVYVKGKFEAIFDTIDSARECRRALQSLKYEDIIISVTLDDINPYEK
tara:strand:+ start:4567 stop:4725 length:159 start_codon:yes stop_codon:yes gene_type:complete